MRIDRVAVTALLAMVASPASFGQEAVQWRVEDGGNGHWSRLVPEALTWLNARDRAGERGGHLATLTTEAEAQFALEDRAAAEGSRDPSPLRHRLTGTSIELHAQEGRIAVRGSSDLRSWSVEASPDSAPPPLPSGWVIWTVDEPVESLATRVARGAEVDWISPILQGDDGRWRVPTDELIVRTWKRLEDAPLAALMARHGLDISQVIARDEWSLPGLLRIRPPVETGFEIVRLADRLSDDPAVRFAEPDFLLEAEPDGSPPNDPFFEYQWELHNTGQATPCIQASFTIDNDVNALEAWTLIEGSPEVLVLVIDNGIQFDHPELLGDPALGFDATPAQGGGWPVHPCDNHGTPVVGVIAAISDNAQGNAGLAHGVRFASARISLVSDDCQNWTVQSSWVAAALAWGEEIGARISNTSWRFTSSAVIADAYAARESAGMLHFASSGNDSASTVGFPARLSSIVALGALSRRFELTQFSNWGVDQELVAPGLSLRCLDRTGAAGYSNADYACLSGTSFASPLAAGVAALVWSANPSLDAAAVRSLLRSTATDLGPGGWDPLFGHGLVRADAAVLAAIEQRRVLGDLNDDGLVDGTDLAILLGQFLSNGPEADLDGDGFVDGADLAILLGAWTA